MRAATVAALLLLLLTPTTAAGRTWRVERDGSGDFQTLQQAEIAAATGDTLLIGPGRYDEEAPFSLPGYTELVNLGISTENLTIRGTDRDAVIIGPESAPEHRGYGIVPQVGIEVFRVENLTVENRTLGIDAASGTAFIRDCTFRTCLSAGVRGGGSDLEVFACLFEDNRDGIRASFLTQSTRVMGCAFVACPVGVQLDRSGPVEIVSTEMWHSVVGINTDGTPTTIRESQIGEAINFAIAASGGARVTILDSEIRDSTTLVSASGLGTHVNAQGSRFVAPEFVGLRFGLNTAEFHGCEFIASGNEDLVRLEFYNNVEPLILDFTHNYWGFQTAEEIAARIHDGNDDPTIRAFVEFEPFATEPIPVQATSLGQLKARFGRARDGNLGQ